MEAAREKFRAVLVLPLVGQGDQVSSGEARMISRIGVIGAGQMGSGIAQVCARAGYEVRLNDMSAEALDRAIVNIHGNLDRQIGKGKLTEAERDQTLGHIQTGTDYAMFAECDLVIEAATEKEAIKREIF